VNTVREPARTPVATNLAQVEKRIAAAAARAGRDPASITLVGVTKEVPPERVSEALRAGLRHCGENIVQDAKQRIESLGDYARTAKWHFIGHLQTNKVAAALRLFDMIHSVDSERLAHELSRRADRAVPVFLEVNIAGEASKYGFSPPEVGAAVKAVGALSHVRLDGLMTVAPAVANPEDVRPVFRELRLLAEANGLTELSMGMTNDFEVAIEEGATIVRVGRAIFGERPS
jgi:pyridoxal phosphate enzyme (YggS family)